MGRRSFWHGKDAQKKRRERRLESGYISRAHEEEDAKKGEYDRVDETKKLQHQHVVLFTEWVLPPTTHKAWTFSSHCIRFLREEKYQPPDYELEPGAPAPDIVCIKDFIRWYIDSSRGCGKVSTNKKPTVRTTCAFAERFFGGFEDATTSKIVQEDRSDIYSVCRFSLYILPLLTQLQWIKKALTAKKSYRKCQETKVQLY